MRILLRSESRPQEMLAKKETLWSRELALKSCDAPPHGVGKRLLHLGKHISSKSWGEKADQSGCPFCLSSDKEGYSLGFEIDSVL